MGLMIRAWVVIVAAASAVMAQTDSEGELLGRIRQHIEASIAELSDYTCQETMERSISTPTGQIEFRERLRLEVLVTSTGELFAWPGSADFTAQPIESWISAGAIGNGNFAIELQNLFVASAATVKYGGPEMLSQQTAYRFNFHAPLLSSKYSLVVNGKSAITAYSGSFWVNKESLDIIRLEHRAEDIPADLDCGDEHDSVNYGRVRLGTKDRLLPSAAELVLVSRGGRESLNSVVFSECRRYTADSSLSFNTTTATADSAMPAAQHSPAQAPAGLKLTLNLEQPIVMGESAAGDQLVARLEKAVTAGGVSLPKGTLVLGRIRRLAQYFKPNASTLVGFEFFAAEPPSGRVTLSARLIGPRAVEHEVKLVGDSMQVAAGVAGLDIEDDGASTGVGIFRMHGKNPHLPRGFRTLWETR